MRVAKDVIDYMDPALAYITYSMQLLYATCAQLAADLEDVCEAVAEDPSSGVLGDWVERVRHRTHA